MVNDRWAIEKTYLLSTDIRQYPNLVEHLIGCLERIKAGGDTAIDRGVQQHFLDLVNRY